LIEYIESEGFDQNEILLEVFSAAFTGKAKRKSNKKRIKVSPKYRNPDNASEMWTGRGRAPLWAEGYKERGELNKILIRGD
jgi:DNA-binding protein H-NS